jgi:hypothetical protein
MENEGIKLLNDFGPILMGIVATIMIWLAMGD